MRGHKTYIRKKIVVCTAAFFLVMVLLCVRIGFLMICQSEYYTEIATRLHERERDIKAARGRILDRNGVILATNRTVCTISVIHNQIAEPDKIVKVLSEELGMEAEFIQKRVEKYTSIERIKSNVDKETGDRIRAFDLAGVKVDEDYKRFYPFETLGSKVLGFTGSDNQGIIGLEVTYEKVLKGTNGKILTVTDATGVEVDAAGEKRLEPTPGKDLVISMDSNIQTYATQLASQVMDQKQAEGVSMLVMNPKNGEILAMVNVPEFNLNEPFTLNEENRLLYEQTVSGNAVSGDGSVSQEVLNFMWRNRCINDTYEPGSTFKIITATAALEAGVVHTTDQFNCPGFVVVEDRRIRCHKTTGHGSEDFVMGIMNSCNPVFVTVGLRVGADGFYDEMKHLGLLEKTGVDLPGEAGTIMHKKKDIGLVELATMSFGQSFQITPMQLATTVSAIINGGNRITPHFGVSVLDETQKEVKKFQYASKKNVVSKETSETMRYLLEQVVENGGGKKAYIEGYRIGGKTATSQTLPRGSGRYIASFVGFAPADDPKVLAMVIIYTPQGIYYGGQIAAPVIQKLFENILPYLDRIDYN